MTDDVAVRLATDSDDDHWLTMRKALWPDDPDARHRLEMDQMKSSEGVVFLAESRVGGVVGFAEVSIRRDHVPGTTGSPVPYLEGWYVDERFRRAGVGGNLLGAIESWCRDVGYDEIASDTGIDNDVSLVAHSRLGFVEIERTVHLLKTYKHTNQRLKKA